ncbi:MAG: glycosyltransferase family 2 protein [Candidatus Limnocylindrus sp.]
MQIPISELSLFLPCHNEAENLDALVAEALNALPAIAKRYEVILVDDGSTDETPAVAARLQSAHANTVRVIRHETNRGYGGALRSGVGGARYEWIAFTDGDRQFRVADLAALIAAVPNHSTVALGYRIERADPALRKIYAALYRLANRVWFGLQVRDVDCAMKLFPRSSLDGVAVASNGAFFSAELLIKLRARGVQMIEVGVPHFPRVAGSASGARLSVVLAAVRDFWSLRGALWLHRASALARGVRLL